MSIETVYLNNGFFHVASPFLAMRWKLINIVYVGCMALHSGNNDSKQKKNIHFSV